VSQIFDLPIKDGPLLTPGSLYYHFAILLLFQPFIKLRILNSNISPKDVCVQAADAIQGLLRSYSQLYTLRRTPSFVPYFTLKCSIMHLIIGASSLSSSESQKPEDAMKTPGLAEKLLEGQTLGTLVAESVKRGIADLTEMAPCHTFAGRAVDILRHLAREWNVDVDMAAKGGGGDVGDPDFTMRPLTTSFNSLAANVMECNWGEIAHAVTGIPGPTANTVLGEATASIESALFWPFPVQGRLILPNGRFLEEAGFAML
jgi:hypothetical protein